MKNNELSTVAIEAGKEQARAVFKKRGDDSYQKGIQLREDELAALLARAYEAGMRAQRS